MHASLMFNRGYHKLCNSAALKKINQLSKYVHVYKAPAFLSAYQKLRQEYQLKTGTMSIQINKLSSRILGSCGTIEKFNSWRLIDYR